MWECGRDLRQQNHHRTMFALESILPVIRILVHCHGGVAALVLFVCVIAYAHSAGDFNGIE